MLFEKLLHATSDSQSLLLQMHFEFYLYSKIRDVSVWCGAQSREEADVSRRRGMLISVFVKQLSRNRKVTLQGVQESSPANYKAHQIK